jgi:hypothetical protein
MLAKESRAGKILAPFLIVLVDKRWNEAESEKLPHCKSLGSVLLVSIEAASSI